MPPPLLIYFFHLNFPFDGQIWSGKLISPNIYFYIDGCFPTFVLSCQGSTIPVPRTGKRGGSAVMDSRVSISGIGMRPTKMTGSIRSMKSSLRFHRNKSSSSRIALPAVRSHTGIYGIGARSAALCLSRRAMWKRFRTHLAPTALRRCLCPGCPFQALWWPAQMIFMSVQRGQPCLRRGGEANWWRSGTAGISIRIPVWGTGQKATRS